MLLILASALPSLHSSSAEGPQGDAASEGRGSGCSAVVLVDLRGIWGQSLPAASPPAVVAAAAAVFSVVPVSRRAPTEAAEKLAAADAGVFFHAGCAERSGLVPVPGALAAAGSPEARAVERGFGDALIGIVVGMVFGGVAALAVRACVVEISKEWPLVVAFPAVLTALRVSDAA